MQSRKVSSSNASQITGKFKCAQVSLSVSPFPVLSVRNIFCRSCMLNPIPTNTSRFIHLIRKYSCVQLCHTFALNIFNAVFLLATCLRIFRLIKKKWVGKICKTN